MRRALATTLSLLGVAVLGLAPAAEAGPFYFFGKLGSTDASVDATTALPGIIDGDDNSKGYGIGFKVGRHLAFQAEYHDLGSVPGLGAACPPEEPGCVPGLPLEADSSAISVTVLPHLLLTRRIRLFGKLGVVSWDSDISTVGDIAGDFFAKRSEEELIYGAGLRLEFPGPLDAFAEYERIADSFETVAIGATWGF